VRGTYDRYEYRDEKAQGFEALAALIEHIVNPQANVIPLRGAGTSLVGPDQETGKPTSSAALPVRPAT
jgi:hypothetical protein